jgi:hypothetical protein
MDPGAYILEKATNHAEQNEFTTEKIKKFRYLVLGSGEETLGWYYMLLDPTIYGAVAGVFKTCPDNVRMEVTHNGKDWATIIAVLNKLMTSTHHDDGDIKDGHAGILRFRDARGGFLGFQRWRLLIEMKPGCGQLFNFSRLRHFNTEEGGGGFYRECPGLRCRRRAKGLRA